MKNETKTYSDLKINPLPHSKVEITATVVAEVWEKFRKEAIKNISGSVKIDGFRKGMIPENVLIAKVGEMVILEEMAELAIPNSYVDILVDNKIQAIGRPQIHIVKLAKGNPLEFKATLSVIPEVKLPDYKKITADVKKKNPETTHKVEEKEIEEAILRVRKSRASHEGHDHGKMSAEEHEKAVMDNLPELTDNFVQSIGDFKDIPDFKEKLSTMLLEDKKSSAREKLRIAIADAVEEATTIDMPDVLVESEVNRTEAQFKSDIERMGVSMEDYLKHAKKSLEELRKEWRPHSEKKAKLQLILNAIADKENVKIDVKEIEAETSHILEHYKDADREQAATYAETVLTNERVFQILES